MPSKAKVSIRMKDGSKSPNHYSYTDQGPTKRGAGAVSKKVASTFSKSSQQGLAAQQPGFKRAKTRHGGY